jgi:hypothetical protein
LRNSSSELAFVARFHGAAFHDGGVKGEELGENFRPVGHQAEYVGHLSKFLGQSVIDGVQLGSSFFLGERIHNAHEILLTQSL